MLDSIKKFTKKLRLPIYSVKDRVRTLDSKINGLNNRIHNHVEANKANLALDNLSRSFMVRTQDFKIAKDSFVLLTYPFHYRFGGCNLGDDIQTIATHNALEKVACKNAKYQYFDRDSLSYFCDVNRGGAAAKC